MQGNKKRVHVKGRGGQKNHEYPRRMASQEDGRRVATPLANRTLNKVHRMGKIMYMCWVFDVFPLDVEFDEGHKG